MKCSSRHLLTCNTKVQLHIVSFNIYFENDFLIGTEVIGTEVAGNTGGTALIKTIFGTSHKFESAVLHKHINLNWQLRKLENAVAMAVWLFSTTT